MAIDVTILYLDLFKTTFCIIINFIHFDNTKHYLAKEVKNYIR